ncbi:MAG: hypothetical protein CL907_04235 [Dehalococcoidia bacterium]|nr:hypothetical protein [Dehalococcoidia bacterium]|tara:strand:- start:1113 stop:2210 length:1098 start_codon:yes stop_codon:yes gene_type:complete
MNNIIIGAGVYGLASALSLLEIGEDVTVIDSHYSNIASNNALGRLDSVLKGSGSSGHLSMQNNMKNGPMRPENQKDLAYKGYLKHKDNYQKLKNLSGIDYFLRDVLTLQVCFDEKEFIQISESVDDIESYGFDITLLEGYKEVSQYQKEISQNIYGAALISGTLFLDSKSFVSCLKKCIEIKGAKILNDIAETIEIDQKKLTLKSGNNINYDNLIVSAGPWTKELIYSSGANINIYPAKGEIIKLDPNGFQLEYHIHGSCSIVRKSDGLIWVAATYEENKFDSNITEESKNELIDNASLMIPCLRDFQVIEQTACVRPATKDGMPIVKEIIKNSGVYVSSGGGGWGIMQSFYIGELIKNMITIKQ